MQMVWQGKRCNYFPLIKDCQDKGQCLTYFGINAHFQNGITEKKICDLQEAIRMAMLFMAHKWPKMIMMNLWPYAMCTANEIVISSPTILQDKTPLELFSGVNITPKL